jgi:hypothetical protein
LDKIKSISEYENKMIKLGIGWVYAKIDKKDRTQ